MKEEIKKKMIINENIYMSKYLINQFKEEFKLSKSTDDFIECYYHNTKNNILKEIIKCMPELFYYKSKEFKSKSNDIKELIKIMKENNEVIYNNIINITKLFIYKSNLLNENIYKIFFPLFYLNNFYDLSKIINDNNAYFALNQNINNYDEILLNLTLSNFNKNDEKKNQKKLLDIKYILYYLNYKLRYCFYIYFKTGEIIFGKEMPFIYYQNRFKRLYQLLTDIKNINYHINNIIKIEDINKLIEYIKNIKTISFYKNNIYEIFELFDITSSISLFLFQIYIDNLTINNFSSYLKEKDPKSFHDSIYII